MRRRWVGLWMGKHRCGVKRLENSLPCMNSLSSLINTCASSFLIDSVFNFAGFAGVARRRVTFFWLSPKESNQRKGDPVRRPYASLRARCGAQKKRGHAQTRCAQTARALIHFSLRSSPPLQGFGGIEFGFGCGEPSPLPSPKGRGSKTEVSRRV